MEEISTETKRNFQLRLTVCLREAKLRPNPPSRTSQTPEPVGEIAHLGAADIQSKCNKLN